MALAAGYARNGRRAWLVGAAFAATGSVLLKLSGLYAIPALLLFVLAASKPALNLRQRPRLRSVVQDLVIITGIFAGLILLLLTLFRSAQVWNQVVTFHWAARTLYPPISLADKWHKMAPLLTGERLLLIATPLAALCLLGKLEGLAAFAWPFFTFIGLLQHYPLYDHHLVALIPGLAAAIGVGASQFAAVYPLIAEWVSVQPKPARLIARSACLAVALAILGAAISQACTDTAEQRKFIRSASLPSPDSRALELIAAHSQPGDMIITDDQGLAFLAARDVPPGLTDTSFTRISSGYLQPREVIEQAEQYNVRLVLFWTGRLSSMPEVVQWAAKRFPLRLELGDGRTLFMLE